MNMEEAIKNLEKENVRLKKKNKEEEAEIKSLRKETEGNKHLYKRV